MISPYCSTDNNSKADVMLWDAAKSAGIALSHYGKEDRLMGDFTKKKSRMLDIFYRAMKGEDISIKKMAEEYEVSTKSITRSLNDIKTFLSAKDSLT